TEELDRQVDADAGAVAHTLRGPATAVGDRAEGLVTLADDVVAGPAVLARDEPDTAVAVLERGVVEGRSPEVHVVCRSSSRELYGCVDERCHAEALAAVGVPGIRSPRANLEQRYGQYGPMTTLERPASRCMRRHVRWVI